MLLIRPEQITLFENAAADHFVPRLEQHLLGALPGHAASLGEDPLRAAVRQAAQQAGQHGFTTQSTARLYAELAVLLGSEFAEDPQLPWTAPLLADAAPENQLFRARQLHEAAIDYLEQVHGADDAERQAALQRFLDEPVDLRAESREQFRNTVLIRLEHLWPSKFKHPGEEQVMQQIRERIKQATQYGFKKEKGVYLFVALGFLLGSGFARDPLHAWARPILNDTGADQPERADRLHQAALQRLVGLSGDGFRPQRPQGSAIQGHPYAHPLDDPEVRAALDRAWQDSQSDDPEQRHQEGGYIVQQLFERFAVERWPRGARGGIVPLPLDASGRFNDQSVLGEFRTLPNPAVDEQGRKWLQEPLPEDITAIAAETYLEASYLISHEQLWIIEPGADTAQALGNREEVLHHE